LAAIDKGGYAEAIARVGFLMGHRDEPLPLSRLQLTQDLIAEYHELLPDLPPDELRRIRGEQEIIVRYDRQHAIETLPALLAKGRDRERLLTLLDNVLADTRVRQIPPTRQQQATLAQIRAVLGVTGATKLTGTSTKALPAPKRGRNKVAARV
jgi:hypothetical protein